MKIVRVKDKITEFSPIFSNVHFFEPLNISAVDLFNIFNMKYYSFIYISDDVIEISSIISNLSKVYENEYTTKVKMLLLEYNPIENYNSSETETSTSENSTTTGNENTTTTTTNSTTENSGETTNKVSPYDNENFNNDNNTTTTNTTTGNATDTTTINDSGNMSSNGTSSRTLTRKGNIGVTTTQQMIESEYELRAKNLVFEFLEKVSKFILLEYIN